MDAAVESAAKRFVARNPKSLVLHQRAMEFLPGGNTRTSLHTAPFPISIERGSEYKLFDEDGNEYIDMLGDLTAGLYGHSHPRLRESLCSTLFTIGLSLGATTKYEQRFAELLCRRFDIDRVRFTNSGTEANLHCLAAVRRFTGRRKVVVFRGGYHGAVLAFNTGVAPNNVDADDWIVLNYNDAESVKKTFDEQSGIAAVLVEGVQSSCAVSASAEFLKTIRDCTQKANAIFIMDEVVTSRLAPGGLKSTLEVKPDMMTLGKYLGGGMPFGAFGGRADIMDVFNPGAAQALSHSGTFQNNCLMLNAGYVGLTEVYTPEVVDAFNKRGEDFRSRLNQVFEGTKFCAIGRGSMMCIHATHNGLRVKDVSCRDDVTPVEDTELKKLFWIELLEAGFWVQPRGSMALNLQLPEEALNQFVGAAKRFCEMHRDLVAISVQ